MAASRRGVAEEKMKRPAAARARRGGKLDRLRQAVQEFVQAAGGQPPLSLQKDSEKQNRRSRRDARKEKRRLKRSRRRRLRRGEPVEAPAAPAKAAAAKAAAAKAAPAKPALAKPALAARPRAPAFPAAAAGKQRPGPPLPAPTPRAALPAAAIASARKRALLEANEEEEKEIRRLERRLGLGKRRKKQEGAAAEKLPQSFLRDGLGYVLGALGCRAGLSRLCESSDDEEEAPAGPREGRPAPEEDEEGPEEDEEGPEDASDPSEEGDVDGEWENESSSSSPEDGGAPEASEPPGEEEEEEVGCSPQIAQTCFSKYVPQPAPKAELTSSL